MDVMIDSGLTAIRRRNLLRSKQAGVGGDPESGFEQSFAALAHSYLRDQAPQLIDSAVGFQLIDRNDDNTKAVGVFGFKLGDQWLYAPVFFLNGDLKGHELLYIKKQDRFVPLKENWVNYLASRKPHVLGESSIDAQHLGGMSPNIARINTSPTQHKFSEWRVEKWAEDFFPVSAAAAVGNVRFMHRDRPAATIDIAKVAAAPSQYAFMGQTTSLEEFIKASSEVLPLLKKICQRYPGVKRAVDKFYDWKQLQGAHQIAVRCEAKKQAEALFDIVPKPAVPRYFRESLTSLLPQPEEKIAAGPKIEIAVSDSVAIKRNITTGINEEERAKLLNDGYLVKDYRTGDEISIAYNTQSPLTLTNPDSSGLYEILEAPGEFSRMLVISSPHTNAGRENFLTICRPEGGNNSWLNADRTAVWARAKASDEDFRAWWDGLSSGELTVDGRYIAVSSCGKGTTVFIVRQQLDDGRYEVRFEDHLDFEFKRPENLPRLERRKTDGPPISTYNAIMNVNRVQGSSIKTLGEELYVPDDFKFIKLRGGDRSRVRITEMSFCCGNSDATEEQDVERPIKPGRLDDVQALFTEKTALMKLIGDGTEVIIATTKTGFDRSSWKQGLFNLIQKHGLSEKQATVMLKIAQQKGDVKYRIKYAYGFPETTGQGPSAPAFPGHEYGSVPVGYQQQRAQFPQEEHLPVHGLQSSQTDPAVYDPWLNYDNDAQNTKTMQTAQMAAQQGQKEVFDVAMIGSMLKAVRQHSLVDRYLGDLVQAIDRLGRILFMFYWHQDEFEDRYGKSDMPELEDSIRNAFETLGDLVIFLREQQAGPDMMFDGPDLQEITGE